MCTLLAVTAAALTSQPVPIQSYSSWSNIFVVINDHVDFEQAHVAVGSVVHFESFPPIAGIQQPVNGRHVVRSLFTQNGVARGFSVTLPDISFAVPDIARFAVSQHPTFRIVNAPASPPPPDSAPEHPPPVEPLASSPPLAPPALPDDPLAPPRPPQTAQGAASGVQHPVAVVTAVAAATAVLMAAATALAYLRWKPAAANASNRVRPTPRLRL